ncbi:Transcription initiation factor TFIID subunit 8 [Spatholobus suberectus]|nr:Transcription initiation factor TFIID subunit 8 [Spatholobus suberectus]
MEEEELHPTTSTELWQGLWLHRENGRVLRKPCRPITMQCVRRNLRLEGLGSTASVVQLQQQREIMNFVKSVLLVQLIPRFLMIQEGRSILSFNQMGVTPPSKHIPAWLPDLPDPHTYVYIHTAIVSIKWVRPHRQSGCCCVMGFGFWMRVVVMGTNHVPVLEAFGPAIEMLASEGLCYDDGLGWKTDLLAVRPTVHFKFRTGKKLIGESFGTRLKKKDALRTVALAGREDERDDKKKGLSIFSKKNSLCCRLISLFIDLDEIDLH